jgi:hypothetical protein
MADVDDVLEQSADRGRPDAGLSEEAAIERLKDRYAAGEIDTWEFEAALEETLTADDPERVVERHVEPASER